VYRVFVYAYWIRNCLCCVTVEACGMNADLGLGLLGISLNGRPRSFVSLAFGVLVLTEFEVELVHQFGTTQFIMSFVDRMSLAFSILYHSYAQSRIRSSYPSFDHHCFCAGYFVSHV
jgi:hypothetical protein